MTPDALHILATDDGADVFQRDDTALDAIPEREVALPGLAFRAIIAHAGKEPGTATLKLKVAPNQHLGQARIEGAMIAHIRPDGSIHRLATVHSLLRRTEQGTHMLTKSQLQTVREIVSRHLPAWARQPENMAWVADSVRTVAEHQAHEQERQAAWLRDAADRLAAGATRLELGALERRAHAVDGFLAAFAEPEPEDTPDLEFQP